MFKTEPNEAGVFRIYPVKPTSDPDSIIDLENVCESPNFAVGPSHSNRNPLSVIGLSHENRDEPFHAPFLNPSVFRLMSWFYDGSTTKSLGDLDNLVHHVINASDFNSQDLIGFSAKKEAKRMDDDKTSASLKGDLSPSNGWLKSSVHLRLPCERRNKVESKAPTYTISDVFHRDVMDIVVSVLQDSEVFPTLHLTPYKEYRILGQDGDHERIYSEVYSADDFYEAWEEVQTQPRVSGEGVEQVVIVLMLWSDSTCLTQFGNASLWPVYLSLGNQSKYIRTTPTSFSYHHLAYLPKVNWSNLFTSPTPKYVDSSRTTFKMLITQYLEKHRHLQSLRISNESSYIPFIN